MQVDYLGILAVEYGTLNHNLAYDEAIQEEASEAYFEAEENRRLYLEEEDERHALDHFYYLLEQEEMEREREYWEMDHNPQYCGDRDQPCGYCSLCPTKEAQKRLAWEMWEDAKRDHYPDYIWDLRWSWECGYQVEDYPGKMRGYRPWARF